MQNELPEIGGSKPLFRYFGSKWMLAQEIVAMIPPHKTYIEPFFGSGAIFFTKPLAKVNIINDLDSNVANFFEVIRENPDQLKKMLEWTPYSRKICQDIDANGFNTSDKIKWAWEFFCWINLTRGTSTKICASHSALRRSFSDGRCVELFNEIPNRFYEASRMLKKAIIENRDVMKLLEDIRKLEDEDRKECFVFLDPPYNADTRSRIDHKYGIDLVHQPSFEDDFLDKTSKLDVRMMVCGYECPKYDEAYKGWNKQQWQVRNEMGNERTETIWYNYDHLDTTEIW